ncbi:uncharacterized protein BXZ73DRAFT_90582 [Epithele typhae]|uniref:uncharacterized protein n=1 Tax=Epithele typhae TaxID=378194 RepID=UPI002008DC62|nr:uncharacterized protein BXZ73DRAFT_90582 [Epithele typhae]KAH9928527.1 hypothetical protein BXZ73DRAFT_90582 [Epithele typhae]
MYEEVCLLCGRPVLADDRAYCSDECESQDVISPSISTTSSAHPSPFLRSNANVPPHLAEVPALLPSALGRSFDASRTRRIRQSESSSSASSTSWSAMDDDVYDDSEPSPALYGPTTDDEYYGVHPTTSRTRRTSSVSTPGSGVSPGIPPEDYVDEDDASDVPASAVSSSIHSSRRHSRKSADFGQMAALDGDEHEEKEDTLTGKRRRNRASLPAYFSLLVSTSTTPRSHKTSALSMLSRSLHSSSSPPTPRVANPVLDTTAAFAVPQATRVSKTSPQATDSAARGRSKMRDLDGRSSSRRSPTRSPRPRARAHHSAQVRARLDSMEKVADWVAHSPVVVAGARVARPLAGRRNSSPPPLPKFEKMDINDTTFDGFAVEDEMAGPVDDVRRGRRRMNELDEAPYSAGRNAPGYGNGRSGLVSRERGRVGVARR